MRLWLFFIWAFLVGGFLFGGPTSNWTFVARCLLGTAVGLVLERYKRDVAEWIARDLSCPDPFCFRCRMRDVDRRRKELEIIEQVMAMTRDEGSTH